MPRVRNRYLEELLAHRILSNPVVVIQGPRQCGKSFLARELLAKHIKNISYQTLDLRHKLHLALENPSSFITKEDAKQLMIIDEAQKAPDLFDAIKEVVDRSRRPGQFLLLGSTEFSHRTKVKESLTGRALSLRLFPFTLGEIKHKPLRHALKIQQSARVLRRDVVDYLERGGMPAVFSIREDETRLSHHEEWIATTIERDLRQVSGRSTIDTRLAREILVQIARNEETSDSDIAKALRVSVKKIQLYLEWFKALFVVEAILPNAESTGRAQHLLCDVGIASSLGAPLIVKLKTWVALEILARSWAFGEARRTSLETYRSSKGGRIDFIYSDPNGNKTAILLVPHESFATQDIQIIESYIERFPDSNGLVFGPIEEPYVKNKIKYFPWEFLA